MYLSCNKVFCRITNRHNYYTIQIHLTVFCVYTLFSDYCQHIHVVHKEFGKQYKLDVCYSQYKEFGKQYKLDVCYSQYKLSYNKNTLIHATTQIRTVQYNMNVFFP